MCYTEIMLHQPTGVIYLACSVPSSRSHWTPAVGRLNETGKSTRDYVATFDPATEKITRLTTAGFDSPRGLSLHGMDVVPSSVNPAELFVYLVNHRTPAGPRKAKDVGADSVIEVFKTSVGASVLTHLRTVADPVIATPNDIAGSADGTSFYFTNDHGALKTGLVCATCPLYPHVVLTEASVLIAPGPPPRTCLQTTGQDDCGILRCRARLQDCCQWTARYKRDR